MDALKKVKVKSLVSVSLEVLFFHNEFVFFFLKKLMHIEHIKAGKLAKRFYALRNRGLGGGGGGSIHKFRLVCVDTLLQAKPERLRDAPNND